MNQDLSNKIHFAYKIINLFFINLLIDNLLDNLIRDDFVKLDRQETLIYHIKKT